MGDRGRYSGQAESISRANSRRVKDRRTARGTSVTASARCRRVAHSTRSAPSTIAAVSCRATNPSYSTPRSSSTVDAYGCMGSPTHARTPALRTVTTDSSGLCVPAIPARGRRWARRVTASRSASGERQMLPVQTMSTDHPAGVALVAQRPAITHPSPTPIILVHDVTIGVHIRQKITSGSRGDTIGHGSGGNRSVAMMQRGDTDGAAIRPYAADRRATAWAVAGCRSRAYPVSRSPAANGPGT